MLTLGQVRESLPVANRNTMTQHMVNELNALSSDPEEARNMRDNFITFAQVLQEGRFKVGDYVSAVMYVSHKMMGKSNLKSYIATFPDRYANMVKINKPDKDISSIVSSYNKGQLVTKVMERAYVPTWLMNQDIFQKALNTQHDLMVDPSVSDKVRCDAANSLLTHLKRPDDNKAELKIEIAVTDGMAALEQNLRELGKKQLQAIEHDPNTTANDIARMPMKDVTPV